MNDLFPCTKLAAAIGLLLAGSSVFADDDIRFSDFTPLAASAGPTADEAKPITFGNASFTQKSIADRHTQLANGKPNSTPRTYKPRGLGHEHT